MTHSDRVAIRLTGRDHESIEKIAAAISQPLRSAPTVSETIRAALSVAAESLGSMGMPR